MGAFPSGQRGQTVNLLSTTSVVRIHPLPPSKTAVPPGTAVLLGGSGQPSSPLPSGSRWSNPRSVKKMCRWHIFSVGPTAMPSGESFVRGCRFSYCAGGFESRLLAECRRHSATGVAFPQKSESTHSPRSRCRQAVGGRIPAADACPPYRAHCLQPQERRAP